MQCDWCSRNDGLFPDPHCLVDAVDDLPPTAALSKVPNRWALSGHVI